MRGAIVALAALLSACTVGPTTGGRRSRRRPRIASARRQRRRSPTPAGGRASTIRCSRRWSTRRCATTSTCRSPQRASTHSSVRTSRREARCFRRSRSLPRFPSRRHDSAARGSARPRWSPDSVSTEYSTYQAGLTASWEIDLWGKVRRRTEAARADVWANEEARRGIVLSVAANAAAGYVALRDLDRRLQIAHETERSRFDSLELFRKRFAGGVISQLELAQVTSEYEAAVAAIPNYEAQIARQETALSLLLGRNPGAIARGKAIDELTPIPIPAGLPSELLDRRPDVREAEQQLISANAQIGAAKALYFPSISLTGAFGAVSTALGDLFTGPARTWSFAAGLTAPIFNAGAIAGQVQQAEAGQRLALANYDKTVQAAFGDVEDALIVTQKSREILAAQQAPGHRAGRLPPPRPPALRQRLHELHRGARRRAKPVRGADRVHPAAGRRADVADRNLQGDGWWLGRRRGGAVARAADAGHGMTAVADTRHGDR